MIHFNLQFKLRSRHFVHKRFMPESVSVPIQSIAKTIELFIRFCVADKLVLCPATRLNHLNNDGASRYFVIPVM